MSIATLSAHQIDAIAKLVEQHADVQDLDIGEDEHRALIVTLWGQADEDLAPYAEHPLIARVTVSVGGTVRDLLGTAA